MKHKVTFNKKYLFWTIPLLLVFYFGSFHILRAVGATCEAPGKLNTSLILNSTSALRCDCAGVDFRWPELPFHFMENITNKIVGINVLRTKFPGGYDGHTSFCLGSIRDKWIDGIGPFIHFQINSQNAETKVSGSGVEPNPSISQHEPELLHRKYVVRNGKLEFSDKTPIHIEVSSPGYKAWSLDLIPEQDVTYIQVPLQPEENKISANKKHVSDARK